ATTVERPEQQADAVAASRVGVDPISCGPLYSAHAEDRTDASCPDGATGAAPGARVLIPAERQYRRVLKLLPAGYRERWEEDMVSAYLDSVADASRRRPWG